MLPSKTGKQLARSGSSETRYVEESPFPPIVPKQAFTADTPTTMSIDSSISKLESGIIPARPRIARPSEMLIASPRPKANDYALPADAADDTYEPESQRKEKKTNRKQGERRRTNAAALASPPLNSSGRRQTFLSGKNLDSSSIEERLIQYSGKRSNFSELLPNEKLTQGIIKRTPSPPARMVTSAATARATQPLQEKADSRVAAAWIIKYYIELFRHRVNKQAFTNVKESFNSKFALVTRQVTALTQEMNIIKAREAEDRKNFMRFKDIIKQERIDGDVELDPSETDLKSPFLRAVMRTHTKESEKFDVFRTELEITQRTCQELITTKTKLEVDVANMKEKETQYYRYVAMSLASANLAISAQFEATARFAEQSVADASVKIQNFHQSIRRFYEENLELKRQLKESQKINTKSQSLMNDLAKELLKQNETEEKLRVVSQELADTSKQLKSRESALSKSLDLVVSFKDKEAEWQRVLECRLMATEEWRSVAVSLDATSQHNIAYTRFLEEQLLLSRKGGARGGSAFSLRAHLHTPKSSVSGGGGLDISPSIGWCNNEGVLSIGTIPLSADRQRIVEMFQGDEDESALASQKIITIEEKLLTLVSDLEDRLKTMDHVRLLSEQENLHKFSEEIEFRRIAQVQLTEQQKLWKSINQNLEDRKVFLIEKSNVVKTNLAAARTDIKTFHDSRALMTKHIADWESKFYRDNGRQADSDETEQAVGYLYEMLDKVQFDLQERMNAVMELSLRYRMIKEELEQIDQPINIARDRATRGLSPVPREVDPKFCIIESDDVQRLDPLDPEKLQSAQSEIASELFGSRQSGFNEHLLNSMSSLPPSLLGISRGSSIPREKMYRPLTGMYPPTPSNAQFSPEKGTPLASSYASVYDSPPSSSLVREKSSLKNRQFDTDQRRLEKEKEIYQKVYENLKAHKNMAKEAHDKLTLDMALAREEIIAINDRRNDIKASLSAWKRDFAIKNGKEASHADKLTNAADLMAMLDQIEALLKSHIHVVTSASENVADSQRTIDDIESHLAIAGQRAERGVSRENRAFDEKYLSTTFVPRNFASYLGSPPISEPKKSSAEKKSSGGIRFADQEVLLQIETDVPVATTEESLGKDFKSDQEAFVALRENEQLVPSMLSPIFEDKEKTFTQNFIVLSESEESDKEIRGLGSGGGGVMVTKPAIPTKSSTSNRKNPSAAQSSVSTPVAVAPGKPSAPRRNNAATNFSSKKSSSSPKSYSGSVDEKLTAQKKSSPRRELVDIQDKSALKTKPSIPKLSLTQEDSVTTNIDAKPQLSLSEDDSSDVSYVKVAQVFPGKDFLSISIEQLKLQKSAAKKAVKQWMKDFEVANNRAPNADDKKQFALDLYTAYNAADKALSDAVRRQQPVTQSPVPSAPQKVNFEIDLSSPMPSPREDDEVAIKKTEVSIKKPEISKATDLIALEKEQVGASLERYTKGSILEKKFQESQTLVANLEKARAIAKKNVKSWVSEFVEKNGREPQSDEKKSQAKDLFATLSAIDNELKLEKSNTSILLKSLEERANELHDLETMSEKTKKDIADTQTNISHLEELKVSSKSDIQNWNVQFKTLNGREPSAKEKREYSTKLYESFAKTETELQNAMAKLKLCKQRLIELASKQASCEEALYPGKSSSADKDVKSASTIPQQTLPAQAESKNPDVNYDIDLSSPVASPRSQKRVSDMKLQMTMESLDQEMAELDRLRSFIDSSSEELREMKAKKAVLKSSIKRWVETFQAAKGRLPTIEDQKSSLEENFFEMYQLLGTDIDSLKKRQDEAYLKIRDSSKNIDRMKELVERIKNGTDT